MNGRGKMQQKQLQKGQGKFEPGVPDELAKSVLQETLGSKPRRVSLEVNG